MCTLGKCVFVLTAAILVTVVPMGAQKQPTFRTEIDYIEFPVRVIDGRGNIIRDLTQSDFQLFEDGKSQQIETFKAVDAAGADGSSDSEPQATILTDPLDLVRIRGQLYLFLIDEHHLRAEDVPRVKDVVGQFIRDQFRDTDRAAIVRTSGGGRDFTGNRDMLLSALGLVRGLMQRGERSAELQMRAQVSLKAIADVADWLAAVRGRHKIMFVVGNDVGCDPITTPRIRSGDVGRDVCGSNLQGAVASAQHADMAIYPLHVGGMMAKIVGDQDSEPRTQLTRAPARGVLSALSILATDTGGFMVADTNKINAGLHRVVLENSFYYLVGYYSTSDNRDGKFRKNEVRLKRKDLRASYRPGYTAPRTP